MPNYTSAVNGFDAVNTHEPETLTLTVKKVWADEENRDEIRPDSLTVVLNRNGAAFREYTLTAAAGWTLTTEALARYEQGAEIAYTWSEPAPPADYTLTGTETEGAVTTLTNTHTPYTGRLVIRKEFSGTENLSAETLGALAFTVTGPHSYTRRVHYRNFTNGEMVINNLPVGRYTVRETGADTLAEGYTLLEESVTEGDAQVPRDGTGTVTLRNAYEPPAPDAEPETVTVEGEKTWVDAENQDGKRPHRIVINLYADGRLAARARVSAASGWTWRFENLPKRTEAGAEIVYTIGEEPVEGYTAVVAGYNVTNIYTPASTGVRVVKVWDDMNNLDGTRPESLRVTLLANGNPLETVTLNAGNGWAAALENLPQYENGQEILYTWTEEAVAGYEAAAETTGSLTVITNRHVPETTRVTVRKIWDDNDNALHIRPKSLRMTLSNGQQVTLNEHNGWTAAVENLPVTYAGQPVTYTWTEQDAPGYVLKDVTVNGPVTEFTNAPWERKDPPPEKPGRKNPPRPGKPTTDIPDYDTPLGVEVSVNHVGHCFD